MQTPSLFSGLVRLIESWRFPFSLGILVHSCRKQSKSPIQIGIEGASALLLAGALLLTPTGDALAASSGGRVGGSGFAASRARAPPPPPPRVSNRT